MAQFARPDADVTSASFTGGFAAIDEATASDADFAYGANNTAAELEVSLSNVTDPSSSTGHVVRYRIARTNAGVVDGAGNAVTVTARLMQGATQIAADTAKTATGTWTEYAYTLSGAEADAITDYADLRLEFVTSASGGSPAARRGAAVSWAELEVPDASITLTPAPVASNPAVPAPTLGLSLALAPGPVPAASAVPVPTLDVVTTTTLTADPVAVSPAVPAPTLLLTLALGPAAVPVTPTVTVPTLGLGAVTLSPTPVTSLQSIAAPTMALTIGLTPTPVPAATDVPVPTVEMAITLPTEPVSIVLGLGPMEALGLLGGPRLRSLQAIPPPGQRVGSLQSAPP